MILEHTSRDAQTERTTIAEFLSVADTNDENAARRVKAKVSSITIHPRIYVSEGQEEAD
jgi:hypothetical protein